MWCNLIEHCFLCIHMQFEDWNWCHPISRKMQLTSRIYIFKTILMMLSKSLFRCESRQGCVSTYEPSSIWVPRKYFLISILIFQITVWHIRWNVPIISTFNCFMNTVKFNLLHHKQKCQSSPSLTVNIPIISMFNCFMNTVKLNLLRHIFSEETNWAGGGIRMHNRSLVSHRKEVDNRGQLNGECYRR